MDAAYNVMAVHRMMCRRSCMSILVLGELLPEGGFAAGEEGVFAGVPAQEMRGLGVEAMVFAGGPDFVEQEGAGDFEGAVQVVGEAAFFAAGGGDEGAEFCFEDEVLAFLGAEDDDQGAMVAGIVLQSKEKKSRREAVASHNTPNERFSRGGGALASPG